MGRLPPCAVPVRLAFLKCLNDLLVRVLPACSFSSNNFDPFIAETARPHSVAAPDMLSGVPRLAFTHDGVCCNDLGLQVSAFRASLFYHTKRKLLRAVLDGTATKPKKAEDEYDYPEELPQIMLNRPRAAASTQRFDHTSRLRHSMFGQMLDALHFLPPHIQRIAYTHPMDDAQQRSFKMKFEGEGVDDYGGPFREVFSQLSAELMATFGKIGGAGAGTTAIGGAGGPSGGSEVSGAHNGGTSPDGAGSGPEMLREFIAEGECVLPLLQPTPNKRTGQGLDREALMLNSRLSETIAENSDLSFGTFDTKQVLADMAPSAARRHARLYYMYYFFLGQVMGVAIRNRVTFPLRLCSMVWKPLVGEALTPSDLFDADAELKAMLRQIRHEIAPYGDEMLEDSDVRAAFLAKFALSVSLSGCNLFTACMFWSLIL